MLGREADAGIADFKTGGEVSIRVPDHFAAQCDAAFFGKFDRISGEVEQYLPKPQAVAVQHRRQVAQVDHQFDAFRFGLVADQVADVVDDAFQLKVGEFELQFAGLDLREVKNVVDDVQQMVSGIGDLAELSVLLWVVHTALQQVREADDGVHRGANLMAHVGQKLALGAVGALCFVACGGQLKGARINQFFKVLAMLRQFFADPLFLGDVFLDRQIVRDPAIRLAYRGDVG